MAAALRAAATKMLRPAVLLGEGMRFLAPMSSLGGDVADVGASSSVGNVTLDLSLASPSVVSIYQETGPTFGELVRKARDSFGICQFVVCAAGGGEKLQQLKDQVKSLKEKNEQLEAQNKKLELGTEIEKAKIKARRFLGYLLIKSKHGGGGEEPPKMPRQGKFNRLRENCKGWALVLVTIFIFPVVGWEHMQKVGGQFLRGEYHQVLESVLEILGTKETPKLLPPPEKCECLLPFCALCGRRLADAPLATDGSPSTGEESAGK